MTWRAGPEAAGSAEPCRGPGSFRELVAILLTVTSSHVRRHAWFAVRAALRHRTPGPRGPAGGNIRDEAAHAAPARCFTIYHLPGGASQDSARQVAFRTWLTLDRPDC